MPLSPLSPGHRRRLTLFGTTLAHAHYYNLALPSLAAWVETRPDLADRWDVRCETEPHAIDSLQLPAHVLDRLLETEPDVLGLSCACWDLDAQLHLAEQAKRARPELRIVLGGPSANSASPELMERFPSIDVVVRGEGETRLAELLSRPWTDLSGVPAILWRRPDGHVQSNEGVPRILDYDELPSPYRSGAFHPPGGSVVIECSRGCRFNCRYCEWRRTGAVFRQAGWERIRDELIWAREGGYEDVFLLDSAVNSTREHVEAVHRAAREADPDRELGLTWFLNASLLDRHQVRLLGDLNVRRQEVGLNTVNPRPARIVSRSAPRLDRFQEQIRMATEIGGVVLHLILGLPEDDLDGYRRTMDFTAELLERHGEDAFPRIRILWMVIPPGSELAGMTADLGIETQQAGIPYVLRTRTMDTDDLVQAAAESLRHPIGRRAVVDGPSWILEQVVEEPFQHSAGVLFPRPDLVSWDHNHR